MIACCCRCSVHAWRHALHVLLALCEHCSGARGWGSMGDAEATELAAALKSNKSVKVLKLRYNEIRDSGAAALAEAIETHPALETLALGNNLIGSRQDCRWLTGARG